MDRPETQAKTDLVESVLALVRSRVAVGQAVPAEEFVRQFFRQVDPDDLRMLQLCEDPIQHTALRPAIHAGVDGVPVAEPLGQTAPFATLLGDLQDRVQHAQIGQAHIAALNRQTVLDQAVLRFADFHPRSISQIQ